MKYATIRIAFVALIGAAFLGCGMIVPADEVYGRYVATYPFGIESITLNRDGTFVQSMSVGKGNPVTVRGKWEFDQQDSRANLYGAMVVTDGSDQLRANWQNASSGIVSMDVEKHWFTVVMNSGSTYPYSKQ
jgi:hypothetical protein